MRRDYSRDDFRYVGAYEDEVGEILDYVFSPKFLCEEPNSSELNTMNCLVVDSLEDLQTFREIEEDEDEVELSRIKELSWFDIQRNALNSPPRVSDREHIKFLRIMRPLGGVISELVDLRRPELPRFVRDDIATDFVSIVHSKCLEIDADCETVRIFWNLYQAGAIPVGWDGAFPSGRVVAYVSE